MDVNTPNPQNGKEQNKFIIQTIKNLQKKANQESRHTDFATQEKYYFGNTGKATSKIENYCNIIKPIVDTKVTFVLDNHITTSVIPKNIHFATLDVINQMQDLADVLEDCKTKVFTRNSLDNFKEMVCRRGIMHNIGIAKVYWDVTLENGLGDVRIECVDSKYIWTDAHSKKINQATFVIQRVPMSTMDLKKKYPEFIEEIESIASGGIDNHATHGEQDYDKNRIISGQINDNVQQTFVDKNLIGGIGNTDKVIDVYECYLKDDTAFIPDTNDAEADKKIEEVMKANFKYPNGRCIIFAGSDLILEDKEMDNPFEDFNETISDTVFGLGGTIENLIYIQDRISRAYVRLQYLVGAYLSTIVLDGACGLNPMDIINQTAIMLSPQSLPQGYMPQVLTNNTLSEIQNLLAYIETLKENAKEVARINDMMMSGERQHGVNSGEMVTSLNESAMTSIRQIQRNFSDFMVRVTNKVIKLVKENYTNKRIIKLSSGDFAIFPVQDPNSPQKLPIQIQSLDGAVKNIEMNIDNGEFECEIISGTEIPKSRSSLSNLTMTFFQMGLFSGKYTGEEVELILRAFDYPNWRAIVSKIKGKEAQNAQNANAPLPPPPVEKINVGFKDLELYPEAQMEILKHYGINVQLPVNTVNPLINQNNQTPLNVNFGNNLK